MQVAKVSVRCADRVNVQPYIGGSHFSWSHWRNCLPIHLPAWLYQWTCSHQELPCCDGWEGSFEDISGPPEKTTQILLETFNTLTACVCHYPWCAHILDPLVVPLELKLTLAIGSSTQQSSMKDTTYNRSSFISILLHGCDRTDYLMMILTKHGYSFTEHEIVCDMKLYCVLWGWDAYTYIPVAEKKLSCLVDRPASEVSNFGALRASFSPAFWVWTQWVVSMKPVTILITKCAMDRPRDLSVLW